MCWRKDKYMKAKEYVFPMRDWLVINPIDNVVLLDGMSFNMMKSGPHVIIILPQAGRPLEKSQIKSMRQTADSIFDISKGKMIKMIFKPSS